MILSGNDIRKRLEDGDIFKKDTWDLNLVKEASYALRVANDGLLLDGTYYNPGTCFTGQYLEIKPGTIAILSTIERLNMPHDLVGKIGIRLDYAARGLTGLMGIQVDPHYGRHMKDERLFIRVANLGNDTVKLRARNPVFTFELHEVTSPVDPPSPPKQPTWDRLLDQLAEQKQVSWTYVTHMESDLNEQTNTLRNEVSSEVKNIQQNLQPVVMFGVFLVAITILGVTISLMLSLRDTPTVEVPIWVTDWAWILMIITLAMATTATAAVGVAAAWRHIQPLKRMK